MSIQQVEGGTWLWNPLKIGCASKIGDGLFSKWLFPGCEYLSIVFTNTLSRMNPMKPWRSNIQCRSDLGAFLATYQRFGSPKGFGLIPGILPKHVATWIMLKVGELFFEIWWTLDPTHGDVSRAPTSRSLIRFLSWTARLLNLGE